MPITVAPNLNSSSTPTNPGFVSNTPVTTTPAVNDAYEAVRPPNPFAGSSAVNTVGRTQANTALQNARSAIVAEFRDNFISSDEFKSTFGTKTWNELKAEITRDAANFGVGPDSETFSNDDGSTTFSGRIYGLYTEATIDSDGQAKKIYFEID